MYISYYGRLHDKVLYCYYMCQYIHQYLSCFFTFLSTMVLTYQKYGRSVRSHIQLCSLWRGAEDLHEGLQWKLS